jgi:hypothetical protein
MSSNEIGQGLMSRGVKLVLAASFVVVGVISGVWAWFLSRRGLGPASEWSSVLQAFAALFSLPGLVIGGLALRVSRRDRVPGRKVAGQSITLGNVRGGRDVDINIRQDQQP